MHFKVSVAGAALCFAAFGLSAPTEIGCGPPVPIPRGVLGTRMCEPRARAVLSDRQVITEESSPVLKVRQTTEELPPVHKERSVPACGPLDATSSVRARECLPKARAVLDERSVLTCGPLDTTSSVRARSCLPKARAVLDERQVTTEERTIPISCEPLPRGITGSVRARECLPKARAVLDERQVITEEPSS